MNTNEKLKRRRRELNLSQEYVAEQLGISRQAVSKWEAGQSTPSMRNLIELAELYRVDISYFTSDAVFSGAPLGTGDAAAASSSALFYSLAITPLSPKWSMLTSSKCPGSF
ncbi:MAG: helix-turn-helix transcriptional regulator [Peptoniphilaceae bacterium]|nr:helix-turn-helix transcriptional regulator [Peptoniphilaceae bacterium]MDY6085454.1 helix-turn-helix transcriptional regulator [Peptoniphilaceae bacterium]